MAKPKKNRPRSPNQPVAGPRDDAEGANPRTYKITLTPAAVRGLDRLSRSVFLRVDARVQALAANPRPAGCIKLQGVSDLYRIRAGDHRIVYQIQDAMLIIVVVDVDDRKDVYRNL
jgi:mRNA interferase RelE/StbE